MQCVQQRRHRRNQSGSSPATEGTQCCSRRKHLLQCHTPLSRRKHLSQCHTPLHRHMLHSTSRPVRQLLQAAAILQLQSFQTGWQLWQLPERRAVCDAQMLQLWWQLRGQLLQGAASSAAQGCEAGRQLPRQLLQLLTALQVQETQLGSAGSCCMGVLLAHSSSRRGSGPGSSVTLVSSISSCLRICESS